MNDIATTATLQKVQLTVLRTHLDLVAKTASDIIDSGNIQKVSPEGLGTRIDKQS